MRICVQWSVEEYSSSKSCTRWHLYVSSASWSKAGYRSSFTIGSFWNPSLGAITYFLNAESAFENSNQNIHSTNESVLKFAIADLSILI